MTCFALDYTGIFRRARASLAGFAFFALHETGTSTLADDLTPRVRDLFESRCRECHHPDTEDDAPSLHRDTVVAELLANPGDYLDRIPVVPGDPDGSGLIARVSLDPNDRRRMPKSRGAKGDGSHRDPLTPAEVQLLKDWIAAMPVAAGALPASGSSGARPSLVGAKSMVAKADNGKGKGPKGSTESEAIASNPQEILPAGAPLEEQVRFVFQERCSNCHNPSNDYPDLSATANLDLLHRPEPSGSTIAATIVERISRSESEKGRMPKSAGRPGDPGYAPPLDDAEKAVIRKWAESSAPLGAVRAAIAMTEVIGQIHADVEKAGPDARYLRYLTLTNLHNATDPEGTPQVDDSTLDSHRAGVGKLINSLSTHGRVTFPEFIDPQRTVFRIDLRNYNWSAEDWERVVRYYPHGIIGIDRQKEILIARATGSRMAYLRADWFTFAVSQPPLYDDVLDHLLGIYQAAGDNDIVSRLESRLGVDRVRNLQAGRAIRAGFHQSGVSEANRLIERHALGSHQGAYWISYDFKRQAADARDNVMRAPLGPKEARLTDNPAHVFDHDGGEIIFHLPNGLQAYLLASADGKRLDRAPLEIVQDNNHPENAIINGISCIRCHDQGMKAALRAPVSGDWDEALLGPKPNTLAGMRDEVGPALKNSDILDFKEKGIAEKLFASPEILQRAVLDDYERFVAAETEATGGYRGALEPVSGLFQEYLRMVDARRLSAELGMPHDAVLAALAKEKHQTESLSVLHNWLSQGQAERRETLLQDYLTLVYALGFELLAFEPLGYEEFGGRAFAELIRQSPEFVAAFGAGSLPVQPALSHAIPAVLTSPEARKNLTQDRVLLPGGGHLNVSIQPKLLVGDTAELVINATADVHVRVIHLSSDQYVTELYPGSSNLPTLLAAGTDRVVRWTTTAPGGPEHVVDYASRQPVNNATPGARSVDQFSVFDRRVFFTTRGVPRNIRAFDASPAVAAPAEVVEAKVGYLLKE